jgi:hypothetical protein
MASCAPRRPAVRLALLLLLAALPARAAVRTSVNLGMDYWLTHQGLFSLTLGVGVPVARYLTVGGRVGAMVGVVGEAPGRVVQAEIQGMGPGQGSRADCELRSQNAHGREPAAARDATPGHGLLDRAGDVDGRGAGDVVLY